MENLSSRLDLLQEQLMNLYEQDSKLIEDQIKQWNLIRQEQVLFHFARKNGVMRIGLQAVPSLASSQEKAKTAIEMVLHLESLKDSPYGTEDWSLQDTSRELFLAPPAGTFKKSGSTLEVTYDNNPDNQTRHTIWNHVYYQNGDDVWRKVSSGVDAVGVYYLEHDGYKNYYVLFAEEASKYSTTGQYAVNYRGKRFTNVMSSTSSPRAAGAPAIHSDYPTLSESDTAQQSTSINYTELPGQGETSQVRQRQQKTPVRRRPYGRRRSRSPRGGGRREGESTPSRTPGSVPSARDVGSIHTTPQKGHSSRLRRLLQEAWDPPVVCVKGGANQLKCLRYRLKASTQVDFDSISTTWHWTDRKNTERIGSARMLVKFIDEAQREKFLERVALPRSVSVFLGQFNGS